MNETSIINNALIISNVVNNINYKRWKFIKWPIVQLLAEVTEETLSQLRGSLSRIL